MPTSRSEPLRLSLSKREAAASLGVSIDHFERHIAGDLRVVYSGARRLYPIPELERWLDKNARYVLKRQKQAVA